MLQVRIHKRKKIAIDQEKSKQALRKKRKTLSNTPSTSIVEQETGDANDGKRVNREDKARNAL